jgi:hypothetical protein
MIKLISEIEQKFYIGLSGPSVLLIGIKNDKIIIKNNKKK